MMVRLLALLALVSSAPYAQAGVPASLAGIDTPAETYGLWGRVAGKLPLIEPVPGRPDRMRVTFLWREASEREVELSASFLLNERRDTVPLERLPNTDIRFVTRELPADARFSYYFVVRGIAQRHPDAVWHDVSKEQPRDFFADPQARRTYLERGDDGRVRTLSWVNGLAATADHGFFATEPKGQWLDYQLVSKALGETRPVSIYVPAGVDVTHSGNAGVLLIFDRETYQIAGRIQSMMDHLVTTRRIRPMIVVLVSPIDDTRRGRDLPPNPKFQSFIADELVPFVRSKHRVSRRAADNIVAGSSYGGLAAMYTGLEHPELFGNVISQSGSFWWYPACCDARDDESAEDVPIDAGPDADMGWLIERYATLPKAPLRIDLNVGVWEGSLMLIPNRMMHHVLRARGYDVHYSEYSGGHDIVQWSATLPEALARLAGYNSVCRDIPKWNERLPKR